MILASTFSLGDGIAVTIGIIVLITLCACGHYLNQIRDILREMQATQRKGVQLK